MKLWEQLLYPPPPSPSLSLLPLPLSLISDSHLISEVSVWKFVRTSSSSQLNPVSTGVGAELVKKQEGKACHGGERLRWDCADRVSAQKCFSFKVKLVVWEQHTGQITRTVVYRGGLRGDLLIRCGSVRTEARAGEQKLNEWTKNLNLSVAMNPPRLCLPGRSCPAVRLRFPSSSGSFQPLAEFCFLTNLLTLPPFSCLNFITV